MKEEKKLGVKKKERKDRKRRREREGMEENDGRRRRRGRSRGEAGAQSVCSQEKSAAGQWTVYVTTPNGHWAVSYNWNTRYG